jgi:hypothetical protein
MSDLSDLRIEAAAQGVKAWHAGDGSDGDALAGLFKGAWWALIAVRPPGQVGPYVSEEAALRGGLVFVSRLKRSPADV